MTQEQYDRWKDFAIRMAKTCYGKHRRPSAAWILDVVEDWFDCFDEDKIPCIENWDNSGPYPEGNRCHGREGQTSYCGCDGWRHEHDNSPNPDCPECRGSGLHYRLYAPDCVTEMVSHFLDEWRGDAPCCDVCARDTYTYEDAECRCEEVEHHYYHQWNDQWGGPICCCVRAGLDMACSPSAGVIGFTAGDVRRMYPEGVPEWVFPPDERLMYWPSGEPDGLFVDLPDEAALCL